MPEDAHAADLRALAQVAAYNRAALDHADRPVLILCTGRPQPYAEAVCRALDCPLAACENGVWVYEFVAHRWHMDPAITPDHLAAVRDFERWVETELGPAGCFLQLGKHASATVFHDDVDYLAHEVVPRIEALIAQHNWPMRVSMTWTCINVDLRHVSKATAIDRIIASHQLHRDRLAGIGDTTSDLFIRDRVAWFGCPANAAETLKPHADQVASRPLAEGVLELIESLR
ncbi:MAG: hypothetical protein DYG94_09385 [Leptolyngbya sp. PLA3]|nr:MAG: hypothetical protein EDM82_11945 [Cyanobacteria bacterium CYA]MCE7968943.1 hypothetical protein [Leptolyngbya sp. PL-A3]